MTAPAVGLQDAVKSFGREAVLDGVNLNVSEGRFIVLRGGNGTGKTTLLRVLGTRLRLSSGTGSVFGFDLLKQAGEIRRRVVQVSVAGGSYPLLTAAENLEFAARLYGVTVDSGAILERVGLAQAGGKLVRTFSSGMKKRLALARLLLPGARMWLLDEPYTTLDEDGRELVDALLKDARQRGLTVMMATHGDGRPGAPLPDAVLQLDGGVLSVLERRES